jgi:hypothetical protein
MSRRKLTKSDNVPKPRPRSPSPYNAYEAHYVYSGGRVTRHRATPDPAVERAERWAWTIARQDMTGFVRNLPDELQFPLTSPVDTHATWAMIPSPTFGLQPNVIPSRIDLYTARIGRAFRWQYDKNQSPAIPLVIFPADPLNPLCPHQEFAIRQVAPSSGE